MLANKTFAQQGLQQVLASVAENNKTLSTQKQSEYAMGLSFKTDLNPENPFVEYDRLPGRPDGAGVQQEFSVTQQLDFPTVYAKKRRLSVLQQNGLSNQTRQVRQQVLLQAKKTFVELVYLNKKVVQLKQRSARARQLQSDLDVKLAASDATALEVNKVKLQSLTIGNELRSVTTRRQQVLQKLAELNGGRPLAVADTVYPAMQINEDFEQLDSLIEATDPDLAVLRQQIGIEQSELSLTKAMNLPKIQVGYHYQSILGQRYQGAHFGLTLPLWENANKLKARNAAIQHSRLRLEENRNAHFWEVRQLFDQYLSQKQALSEYEESISGLTTQQLLDSSLELKHITVIDYVLELNYLNSALDARLELEKDLNLTLAELTRYQL